MRSTDKLVQALEEADDPRLADIIKRARRDYYHDFNGVPVAPEMQLLADLMAVDANSPAITALCDRIRAGDFDATKAESDEWARSAEGRRAFRELMGGG
jgi:hypothetical protein